MEYRQLGRTNLKVSAICLGTMTWGRQNTLAEAHEQMDYALDVGVNFWDTAEMYPVAPQAETHGFTEEYIGKWFKARGKRDQVILASKIAGPGIAWVRNGKPITGATVAEAIEGSLKRLQTDYIDLYQIHWPNRPGTAFGGHWTLAPAFQDATPHNDTLLEILRALDTAIKAGKIRHAGLSNESAWGTMRYLQLAAQHNLPRMASIQNEYSLLDRIFEPDLAEVAAYEQVGLLAWSPLAGGMISGKYLDGARPPKARWTEMGNRYIHRDTPAANAAVKAYMHLAKEHGLDICQMALAFVTDRPFTTSNIIGATTMAQLKTDIASAEIKLSAEVMAGIEKIRREYPIPY
jgi:aryl-alcohol dehydrogenase-like predicted oxidoreductase